VFRRISFGNTIELNTVMLIAMTRMLRFALLLVPNLIRDTPRVFWLAVGLGLTFYWGLALVFGELDWGYITAGVVGSVFSFFFAHLIHYLAGFIHRD
jgi:hypothetical protein